MSPVHAGAAAVTVMGASVLAFGDARVRAEHRGGDLRLLHDLTAAGTARRAVADDLRRRGIDEDLVAEVSVVLSELVANAVRHARPLDDGSVRLRWQVHGGDVHLQVTDGCTPGAASPLRPVDADGGELRTGGRGLRIVAGLADAWGSSRDAAGRCTVWAELDGDRERRSA